MSAAVQAVFDLSFCLNKENYPTQIPGSHSHRILEIDEQELKDCLSEFGWKVIEGNVAALRIYKDDSVTRHKAQQKALKEQQDSQIN